MRDQITALRAEATALSETAEDLRLKSLAETTPNRMAVYLTASLTLSSIALSKVVAADALEDRLAEDEKRIADARRPLNERGID